MLHLLVRTSSLGASSLDHQTLLVNLSLSFVFTLIHVSISVPSAPPSRFCISVLDSQTFLVRWVQVPLKHQNGIIRGYRLTYWNAVNGTSSAITMKDYQRSYVLRPLRKATKYVVQLWAFTNAGDGTVGTYTALTDEDGK